MSYFIPKTNNYFGLMPVSVGSYHGNFPSNYYLVSSSEATQINIGDVVIMTTNATARVATGAYVATSSAVPIGVAASIVPANGGSTAATLLVNTSQMVMVWDSPAQVFGITESSSGILGAGPVGLYKNYAILASGVVGSTGPFQFGNAGRSVMALSGVTATAVGAVKLVGLHPVEQGVYSTVAIGTASTDTRKWLVEFIAAANSASTGLTSVVNTTS